MVSYDPYVSVLWTVFFYLGQIVCHFVFFFVFGGILTRPQSAKITFLHFCFQNLIFRSLKSKTMAKPHITICIQKTASESFSKVENALNSIKKTSNILAWTQHLKKKNNVFFWFGAIRLFYRSRNFLKKYFTKIIIKLH